MYYSINKLKIRLSTTTALFGTAIGLMALAVPSTAMAQNAENTVTVSVPSNAVDSNSSNNSATDSDLILAAIIANDDSINNIDGLPATNNVLNVLDADTLNGLDANISNVIISLAPNETLPSELSFDESTGNISVLANTPAGTYEFDYQICERDNPTNCVTATASVTVIRNDANLVTVKSLTSGSATPAEGETVTFTITVTNQGAAQASNVTLSDELPSGLTATSNNGSVSAGTYNSSTGVWSVPTLANGANATLTIEGVVDPGQGGNTITNTLALPATSDQNDPTTVDDDLTESVTVEFLNVNLSVTKTNTPGVNAEVDQATDTVTSGSTVTYVITVTNNGPDSVTGALVRDVIGSGLTCSPTNSVTIVGSGVPSGSFTVSDLTGSGITLDTLTNGQSVTLSYSCEVN